MICDPQAAGGWRVCGFFVAISCETLAADTLPQLVGRLQLQRFPFRISVLLKERKRLIAAPDMRNAAKFAVLMETLRTENAKARGRMRIRRMSIGKLFVKTTEGHAGKYS